MLDRRQPDFIRRRHLSYWEVHQPALHRPEEHQDGADHGNEEGRRDHRATHRSTHSSTGFPVTSGIFLYSGCRERLVFLIRRRTTT